MSDVTQVAFQLDNTSLREVDKLVATEFPSRAEAFRTAVHEMLRTRRERAIDAQLAAGYGTQPPGGEVKAWADTSIEGLRASELDW